MVKFLKSENFERLAVAFLAILLLTCGYYHMWYHQEIREDVLKSCMVQAKKCRQEGDSSPHFLLSAMLEDGSFTHNEFHKFMCRVDEFKRKKLLKAYEDDLIQYMDDDGNINKPSGYIERNKENVSK